MMSSVQHNSWWPGFRLACCDDDQLLMPLAGRGVSDRHLVADPQQRGRWHRIPQDAGPQAVIDVFYSVL